MVIRESRRHRDHRTRAEPTAAAITKMASSRYHSMLFGNLIDDPRANEMNVMKPLASLGGFMFASFLTFPFAADQILRPDNVYVLQAGSRQATTTAPLTLTCSEPFKQGK
jgi:hypothetical protein